MKKTLLLISILILLLACETGVKNNTGSNKPVLSGIVNRTDVSRQSYSKTEKSSKKSLKKIFSKSKQPGYYLQMAVFAKNKPSKIFLEPLENSKFKYIVLNHLGRNYVLIGPYKSYNAAKSKVTMVNRSLQKHTFPVQVLRP